MRLVLSMTLLEGCGGAPPPAPEAKPEPIRVVGAENLLAKLVPALVDTYRKAHPEVEFALEPTGTALGFRALLDGEADLVTTARPASPSEEEQAKVLGFSFDNAQSVHIVAVDVVGVAVHPRNTVEHLSYDQVIAVFCTPRQGTADQRAQNWSEIGGPDRPIHVVAPDLESGSRALFEDFFCGLRGIDPKIQVQSTDKLAQTVATDEDAVTIASLSESAGKMLALLPDVGLPPVRPSLENVTRGSYPLYGDLYLVTRGTPTGDLGAFLKWVEEPGGQEVVDDQRFVPLFLRPPTRADEARPLRETVHFDPGVARPDSRSLLRLQLLIDEIKVRQVRHVILEGYTDNEEPAAFQLSEQRAVAVRELIAPEVPDVYFEIIPRGPKSPIAPNNTPMGRMINRRVQVYIGEEEREQGDAGMPPPTP